MNQLSPARRRELKAQAHHLNPVVSVAGNGLTDNVLHEIDIALKAHELIKIRVYGAEKSQRAALIDAICEASGAAPVQHIGNILIVWRQKPEPPATKAATPTRAVIPAKVPRRVPPARSSGRPSRPTLHKSPKSTTHRGRLTIDGYITSLTVAAPAHGAVSAPSQVRSE